MGLSQQDHIRIFESIRAVAERMFKVSRTQNMSMPPAIMTVKNEGEEVDVFIISNMDESAKDSVSEFMVELVDKGAQAVAFVSESWMVSVTSPKDYNIKPSTHPDRIEVVYIAYSFIGGEWGSSAVIEKQPQTQENYADPTDTLGEWKVDTNGVVKGRFSHIWSKARARHAAWN
jgi:hypothetical protein